MERARNYLGLPRLRMPSLQQLRDGSFWKNQDQVAEKEFSLLAEFECRLAQVQEVALWSSPVTSLMWLVLTQLMVYHVTSSPLLPIFAKLTLATFIYSTWVYRVWPAIRVPPKHPEDTEHWTTLHPDVLSAPELDSCLQTTRQRVKQVVTGQQLLRLEQPGRFCVLSSTICLLLAVLGMQTSTAFLLHSAALLVLTLPALLVRGQKVACLAPWLDFLGELLGGLGDLCVYRGLEAPPLENKELDEFVPEVTTETASLLEKALSYVQRKEEQEQEQDTSLTAGLSIPSHEEVELDRTDPDTDLLPVSSLALDHGSVDLESEDECDLAPGQLSGLVDSDEEDSCSDLEPMVGPVMSLVTGSVTGVTATVTSVTSTVSSVTSALLGNFLNKSESEPDLEDFELVNESDLEQESP